MCVWIKWYLKTSPTKKLEAMNYVIILDSSHPIKLDAKIMWGELLL